MLAVVQIRFACLPPGTNAVSCPLSVRVHPQQEDLERLVAVGIKKADHLLELEETDLNEARLLPVKYPVKCTRPVA